VHNTEFPALQINGDFIYEVPASSLKKADQFVIEYNENENE